MNVPSKADNATGVDFARASIRTAILQGEFVTGAKLTLTDLAERFGTSVTPIREALRDLAGEGLVDLDPHKGARVHSITATELRETYVLLGMLEVRATRELALLSEEERAVVCIKASRLIKQMENETNVARWEEINRVFHMEIFLPLKTAWPRLYAYIETLRNFSLLSSVTALKVNKNLMKQANSDHQGIIRAISKGDADTAEAIMFKHIEHTWKVILSMQHHYR